MKNLKKLLMCIACALTLAFAGVINFIPASANKAFASQEEPIPISTGVEINTAIKSLQTQTGGSFKNILYVSSEEFSSLYGDAVYSKELVYEGMKIYLFVTTNDTLYYYGDYGDGENVNREVFLPEDISGMFSGLSAVEKIDLSGFNTTIVSVTSNMFEGCTSLNEVVFGFNSTSLFTELAIHWTGDIYEKESGNIFEDELELDEGDTITLIIKTDPVVEAHDFSYEVGGDNKTITATCANGNCELDNNKVSVSLTVSNKTYDGNAVSVEVSNKETFETITGQTVAVEYEGVGNTEYSKTTTAPVNAGTYKASITVDSIVAYQEFEIAKANSVLDVAPTANALEFNGNSQILISAGSASNGTVVYKLESGEYSQTLPTALNAGTYKVYYKVIGDSNYNDVAEAYIEVTIAQKEVVINWSENDFTYTGLAQTVTATYKDVENQDVALNVSLSAEFKNAGEYTATVSFKNSETNYQLPATVTKTYNISKIKVAKPEADDTVFAYTGETLTYEVAESDYYTVSNNTQTEVGKYNVSVVLKDKANTEWSDSTTADLTFEFVINKVKIETAEDAEGNPSGLAKIESVAGGINPDTKLVVSAVDISNSAEKTKLENAIALENNKEILAAIDVKFMLNSAEVQPNGKVVLKIKVPEVVGNKTYELFHVHTAGGSASSTKLTYTAGQDGYISVEVENFSAFVFVTEKATAPIVPTPAADDSSNLPLIFLGLLGGFAILFLLWFFILKRQKYDIVSKIVVSIFETVGVVLLCKFRGTDAMTYVIVDLVAFICVDIIYMVNTARETKKEEQKALPEKVNA